MSYIAKRRFSFIDIGGIAVFSSMLSTPDWWVGLLVIALTSALTTIFERADA